MMATTVFPGEQYSSQRPFKHVADLAHLVPLQEFFIEEVAVKLDGDLFYLLAFTLVHEPGMLKVWSNQHEFYIIDLSI
jgi:hypothetical protein